MMGLYWIGYWRRRLAVSFATALELLLQDATTRLSWSLPGVNP